MADEKIPAVNDQEVFTVASSTIKLDSHGLPLSPQPSDDPEDPLNWPLVYRLFVLTQVSLLASLGNLNIAAVNPTFSQLAEEFGISTVTASYQTTVAIAINGLAPFLCLPIANAWGRRPVYLIATFIGFGSALGSAYSQSFPQLLGARIVNGIFPVASSLGVGTITDMFFLHQRGRAMGVYTMLMTNGSHVALIIGGVVGQFLGWRWIFKLTAICDAFMFLLLLFCFPETLYRGREPPSASIDEEDRQCARGTNIEESGKPPIGSIRRHIYRLRLRRRYIRREIHLGDFVAPVVRIARYPSVLFPALYYAAQHGFGTVLPAIIGPTIFPHAFGWKSLQIGLATGAALTIGCPLGEFAGGWVVDSVMNKARQRHGENAPSEFRLKAVWTGEILVPAGLLIFGFGVQYGAAWPGPIVGVAVSCFGAQCITTVMYTYSTDRHREQSMEVAQVFNFFRQEIGMTFAFYAVHLATAMGGYQWLFILFSGIGSVLAFLPIMYLMYRGTATRA